MTFTYVERESKEAKLVYPKISINGVESKSENKPNIKADLKQQYWKRM